jgi:hypothetical protein
LSCQHDRLEFLYELASEALFRAAMERHHGDFNAASEQLQRWLAAACADVAQTRHVRRTFAEAAAVGPRMKPEQMN